MHSAASKQAAQRLRARRGRNPVFQRGNTVSAATPTRLVWRVYTGDPHVAFHVLAAKGVTVNNGGRDAQEPSG